MKAFSLSLLLCLGLLSAPVTWAGRVKPNNLSIGCSACEIVITLVEDWLSNGSTEQEIITKLQTYCNSLPVFVSECEQIAQNDVPQIINWIEQSKTPNEICGSLSFCSTMKALNVDPCGLCKTAAGLLEQQLQNPDVQKRIQGELSKLCPSLPSPAIQQACQGLVAEIPELVQLLEKNLTPDKACEALKLCSANVAPFAARRVAASRSSSFCTECNAVAQLAGPYLSQLPGILNGLIPQACQSIPAQYQDTCQKVLQAADAELTQALQNPSALCNAIAEATHRGSCNSLTPKFPRKLTLDDIPQTLECEACDLLFKFVDQDLLSADIQSTVTGYIKKACNYLPASAQQQCDDIIDKYGQQLFGAIVAQLAPNNVCVSILGICTAPSKLH